MPISEEGPGGREAQAWPPFIPTLVLKMLNPAAEVGGLTLKARAAVVGVTRCPGLGAPSRLGHGTVCARAALLYEEAFLGTSE